MFGRFAAVAVIGLFALSLYAQMPVAGERIQVTLVEVPVNVVDRNGAPVRNLTQNNFELFDDGQRRQITHFEKIDLADRATRLNNELTGAAARNFLILFDLGTASPGTLTRAREAAQRFVDKAAVDTDRIAIGTFTAETGFRLLTGFTTDRKLNAAAIATLGAPKYFQPADPLLLSAIEMRHASFDAESDPTRNSPVLAEELREHTRNLERSVNDVQRQYIRRTLDGYAELAQLLDRVAGRKQVILLTEGFDAKLIHGRESLTNEQARQEEHFILRGEAWRVDNDNRYGDAEVRGELTGMLNVCRRSDVVLNAIDIRGIRNGIDVRDTGITASNESLFLLTHDTGGMVFKNANNLDDDFRRFAAAQEVVYILGFEAPSSKPGKFHDLKVKLVDVPSGRALARAGYTESIAAASPIERTLTAAEIISNRLPVSDLRVATFATPFPRSDGPAQVPVIVEIDGQSMLRTAHNNEIQSELFIYAFDENNVIHDFVHQPIRIDVVKLRDRLQQKGVRVYETLMLPAGRYSVRSLVRAGSESAFGYSDTTIEVPAFNQPAVLGGSAIDDKPGEWVPVKPPDRQGVPRDYPFTIAGAMLVPAAAPVLRPGVATRLGLYAGKLPDTVSVAASINGRDTPVNIAARTAGANGVNLLLDFVPPQLPAGRYELTLRVPEAGSRNVAVVPFIVR